MTDRERLVETMAKALNDKHGPETMDEVDWEDASEVFKGQYRDEMRFVLAALEAAGYAVYRPEDSVLAEIRNGDPIPIDNPIHLYDPDGTHRLVRCGTITGTYRLVPVGGDS